MKRRKSYARKKPKKCRRRYYEECAEADSDAATLWTVTPPTVVKREYKKRGSESGQKMVGVSQEAGARQFSRWQLGGEPAKSDYGRAGNNSRRAWWNSSGGTTAIRFGHQKCQDTVTTTSSRKDEANRTGGKWIVRLRKGLASRCWENLILAILGEQFMVGEEVCGAVASVRFQEDINPGGVSIWNRTASDSHTTLRIRDTLRRVFNPAHQHRHGVQDTHRQLEARVAISCNHACLQRAIP
ncbi:uncharacterized protein LOC144125897 isoform X2 [Amblyomma americanum]